MNVALLVALFAADPLVKSPAVEPQVKAPSVALVEPWDFEGQLERAKAIRELKAEIAAVKKELAELKESVSAVKGDLATLKANCCCNQQVQAKPSPSVEVTVKDALDELNAQRAQRGLPPYRRDPALTKAAMKCASTRAKTHVHGHMQGGMSDFTCLDAGVPCECTGAEAPGQNYPPGFWTCAMYDNYTVAGAARAFDERGEQYMSLFCGYGKKAEPAPQPVFIAPQPQMIFGGGCPGGNCSRGR